MWVNGEVQLTGSNVAFEAATDSIKTKIMNTVELQQPDAFQAEDIIFPRAQRTATPTSVVLTPPAGAKGFIAELIIQAVVGTFAAGEGLRLVVQGSTGSRDLKGLRVETNYENTAFYRITLVWYPGATAGNLFANVSRKMYYVPIPIPKVLRFDMELLGTALGTAGNYIDAEAQVGWLT